MKQRKQNRGSTKLTTWHTKVDVLAGEIYLDQRLGLAEPDPEALQAVTILRAMAYSEWPAFQKVATSAKRWLEEATVDEGKKDADGLPMRRQRRGPRSRNMEALGFRDAVARGGEPTALAKRLVRKLVAYPALAAQTSLPPTRPWDEPLMREMVDRAAAAIADCRRLEQDSNAAHGTNNQRHSKIVRAVLIALGMPKGVASNVFTFEKQAAYRQRATKRAPAKPSKHRQRTHAKQ